MARWRGFVETTPPCFSAEGKGAGLEDLPPAMSIYGMGPMPRTSPPALSIHGEGANAIWQLFEADGEDLEAEGASIDADAGLGGGLGACGVAQVDDAATGLEGDLDA